MTKTEDIKALRKRMGELSMVSTEASNTYAAAVKAYDSALGVWLSSEDGRERSAEIIREIPGGSLEIEGFRKTAQGKLFWSLVELADAASLSASEAFSKVEDEHYALMEGSAND